MLFNRIFPEILFIFFLCILYNSAFAQQFLNHPLSCSHKKQNAAKASLFQAQADPRSDSISISHYNIKLDITDFAGKKIKGSCQINLKSKINHVQQVNLDLLALTVDSVKSGAASLVYTHVGERLMVTLPTPLAAGDSIQFEVFYGGQPVMDASGWGGFYFSGTYAYNLGVGFAADPHNYGRVWYPCLDNFVDRALYDFQITTSAGKKAFCNGLLVNSVNNPNNTITWHWKLNQTIPTYLVSVAVGDYTTVNMSHVGLNGIYPIQHGAVPADTTNLKNSFVNLGGCIDAFEKAYGPFLWDRVGFVLVPFSSGAMEHATNIAYPRAAANGSLNQEGLMAHEFAHHWWGNLVTCKTAEDMWINEGWATYSQMVFFEGVYGEDRYRQEVASNHKLVLQFAHVQDEGFRAVSGVPHEYTYGTTVYKKGADVAHTLRGYLGDSLFFSCITAFLDHYKFNDVTSIEFRDYLSQCSGRNMGHFFDGWVFNPGFPHFSIDSFTSVAAGGNIDVTVNLRQKLKAAPDFYNEVPLEVAFYDNQWNSEFRTIYMSGRCGYYTVNLPFQPVLAILDPKKKISDAITAEQMVVSQVGNVNLPNALLSLNVKQISDSALVRIEHNWVAADPFKTPHPGLHISPNRYWKIDGLFPQNFNADITFNYNGTNSASAGHLDNGLLTNTEDSLIVMYRQHPGVEWQQADSFTVNTLGASTSKTGNITVKNIQKGEYALAIYDAARPDTVFSVPADTCLRLHNSIRSGSIDNDRSWNVYPNPAGEMVTIEFKAETSAGGYVAVTDISGKEIYREWLQPHSEELQVDTSRWSKGIYFVQFHRKNASTSTKKILIQ